MALRRQREPYARVHPSLRSGGTGTYLLGLPDGAAGFDTAAVWHPGPTASSVGAGNP